MVTLLTKKADINQDPSLVCGNNGLYESQNKTSTLLSVWLLCDILINMKAFVNHRTLTKCMVKLIYKKANINQNPY